MANVEVITKSRLAVFSSCQRLHNLQYNLGYRAVAPRELAEWGSMFHAGLDAWWGAYKDADTPEAPGSLPMPGTALAGALEAMGAYAAGNAGIDEAAKARADVVMAAYDARWGPTMHEWEVLGIEVEFVAVVPGRKRLRVAGKIDKVLRRRADGTVWFGEHKSSGADLSAGSTYWQRLRMDPQVSIYFAGMRSLGHDPVGCLYDVVVRPAIKMLKATPVDQRKYTKPTKTESSRLYSNQREQDETAEEFRERLADVILKEPEAYFARAEVVRLESEIEESARDVEETALQIRALANAEHAPRNPGACFQYNRPCEFIDLCSGLASIDDTTKFRRTESVHEELSL